MYHPLKKKGGKPLKKQAISEETAPTDKMAPQGLLQPSLLRFKGQTINGANRESTYGEGVLR